MLAATQAWATEIAAAKLLTHPHWDAADWCSERCWRLPVLHATGPDVRRPSDAGLLASL
eukprot:COSAG01_NODE_1561_length_9917_cov_5.742514_5_plen_59_part_00